MHAQSIRLIHAIRFDDCLLCCAGSHWRFRSTRKDCEKVTVASFQESTNSTAIVSTCCSLCSINNPMIGNNRIHKYNNTYFVVYCNRDVVSGGGEAY